MERPVLSAGTKIEHAHVMKKSLLLLLLALPFITNGQQKDLTDSTTFRYGLPVSNDDTTREVRSDQDPANQWILVSKDEIPRKLRRKLERNDLYRGWEKANLYYDRSIDQYLLRLRRGNAIATYGLAADGSPVSFTEENILSEDSID